jgi:hypothetical protein
LKNNFNRLHYFDQVRPESGHLSAFPDDAMMCATVAEEFSRSLEARIVAQLVSDAGLMG